jgi:hypothetical protein
MASGFMADAHHSAARDSITTHEICQTLLFWQAQIPVSRLTSRQTSVQSLDLAETPLIAEAKLTDKSATLARRQALATSLADF